MSDSDPLGNIELESEDSFGTTVLDSLPMGGGDAVKLFKSGWDAASDGNVSAEELASLASDGADFVSSCAGLATELATDPIGTLVSQGLDFLLAVCQPLQDLLHMVTGDGPALSVAAENFGKIGEGIAAFGSTFADEAVAALSEWEGDAADAAAGKLAEFGQGIKAVAGEAGNIAQLLQVSSMVMTVIEEFIMALLTEFITWLIMIWIPALAAAYPTAGASTAAAATATGVRAVQTGTRASRQVSWLGRLLKKIKDVLAKLKDWMSRKGKGFREAMDDKRNVARQATDAVADARNQGTPASRRDRLNNADGGLVGERVDRGFRGSMADAARDAAKEQVNEDGITGHLDGLDTGRDYDDIGEERSTAKTSEQLNF